MANELMLKKQQQIILATVLGTVLFFLIAGIVDFVSQIASFPIRTTTWWNAALWGISLGNLIHVYLTTMATIWLASTEMLKKWFK